VATCNGVRTCDDEWTWPCAKPLDIARKRREWLEFCATEGMGLDGFESCRVRRKCWGKEHAAHGCHVRSVPGCVPGSKRSSLAHTRNAASSESACGVTSTRPAISVGYACHVGSGGETFASGGVGEATGTSPMSRFPAASYNVSRVDGGFAGGKGNASAARDASNALHAALRYASSACVKLLDQSESAARIG
jgi:hypothetical protein